MGEATGVTVQQRRTPAEIEEVVAKFAGSGLNRTAFCRREHIGLGTLNRYLKRLREAGSGGAGGGLVAVELAGAKSAGAGGSGLAVVLGGGRKIEVGTGFDGGTLERLVRLLERR